MSETSLKPCPFCGTPGTFLTPIQQFVGCLNRRCILRSLAVEADAWNSRPAAPASLPLTLWQHLDSKPDLIVQTLEAQFTNGRNIDLTFRGSSVSEIINALMSAAANCDLDREAGLSVVLEYWQLDEDLQSISVRISEDDYDLTDDPALAPIHALRFLLVRTQQRFMRALANQQIALHGPTAALEAYPDAL